MLKIAKKSIKSTTRNKKHKLITFELKSEDFQVLVNELIELVPNHYIDPTSITDILERLGKKAASQKLKDKVPTVKNIRSGDIGEVIASDYIEEYSAYSVPIKKLRWRDHRDMAMRGDDVLGILINSDTQKIKFLKAEAKSNKSLSRDVLTKARNELDSNGGLPAPHALSFVIDRLKEINQKDLADKIEYLQLVEGIKTSQVKHLLFTFTSSNPNSLQKEAFEAYHGNIAQVSVCLRTQNHQELINHVYKGIESEF